MVKGVLLVIKIVAKVRNGVKEQVGTRKRPEVVHFWSKTGKEICEKILLVFGLTILVLVGACAVLRCAIF